MGKNDFKSVDEYIGSQPEAVQATLAAVRAAIQRALPRAEETLSYKIPAYKLHGEAVLYFAAWKRHFSLYPAGARLAAAFQDELGTAQVVNSTLRFALSEPVPVRLIE
ncbi:MAG: DUF1801 domain-containing protein, partial [Bryobacteraceae bacterium]